MEWQAVRARALRSQQDAKAAARDETLALERLRQKLGLALEAVPLRVVSREASPAVAEDIGVLVKEALASRPDVRAAELELEAAGKRAGLERAQAISLSGILDANGEGREGFEAGPGLAAAIPFFNLNQSGMQRARAELEQASQNYFALRQRVATEVRIAAVRFRQAEESRRAYRQEILPALEEAQARAQRAYELGEVSYLEVLFSTRELLHARLQEAAHSAEVTQARAELERSVGRKL
jgi:cobalt-zinc-cadmium efflux system outer membrane protein